MWRILNKLFGWDYVMGDRDHDVGSRRVRVDALGNPFYIRRFNLGRRISSPDQVIWLTCHPSKYLGESDD